MHTMRSRNLAKVKGRAGSRATERSHRRALATEAQSWSKRGQSTAAGSTRNISLTVVSPSPKSISPSILSSHSLVTLCKQNQTSLPGARSPWAPRSPRYFCFYLSQVQAARWGATAESPPCSLRAPALPAHSLAEKKWMLTLSAASGRAI